MEEEQKELDTESAIFTTGESEVFDDFKRSSSHPPVNESCLPSNNQIIYALLAVRSQKPIYSHLENSM